MSSTITYDDAIKFDELFCLYQRLLENHPSMHYMEIIGNRAYACNAIGDLLAFSIPIKEGE